MAGNDHRGSRRVRELWGNPFSEREGLRFRERMCLSSGWLSPGEPWAPTSYVNTGKCKRGNLGILSMALHVAYVYTWSSQQIAASMHQRTETHEIVLPEQGDPERELSKGSGEQGKQESIGPNQWKQWLLKTQTTTEPARLCTYPSRLNKPLRFLNNLG